MNSYIVGEDNICPITKQLCDDECCPLGSICNVSGEDGVSDLSSNRLEKLSKIDYILLQDINWFGRNVLKGTIYKQINGDYYQPTINQAQCPSLQIDFYTVMNNINYFLEIQK